MTIAAIPSFPVEALPRPEAPDPARGTGFEAVLEAVSSRPEPDRSQPEPRAERADRSERRERADRADRTERTERRERTGRAEARRSEPGGKAAGDSRCEAPDEPDDTEEPDGTEATAAPIVAVVVPPGTEVPTEIVTEAGPGAAETAADVPTGPASAHAVGEVAVGAGATEAEALDPPSEGEAPADAPEPTPSGVVPATPAEPDGAGPATPATPASPAVEHRSPHATEHRTVEAPATAPEPVPAATAADTAAPVTEAESAVAPAPDATFQVAETEPPPAPPTIPAVAGTPATSAAASTQGVGAAERSGAAGRLSPAVAVEQVEAQIISLRHRPDGSYRMRFELRPPELGRVEIHVELRDGVLHARMRADQTTTGEVLRDALGDLRARLETQGMPTGDLSVDSGSGGAGERRDDRAEVDSERRQQPADAGGEHDEHRPPVRHESSPSSLLDLRM